VAEKREVLKFCPLVSSTAGGWSTCEEDNCALYVEEAGRCCLWMLAFHLDRVKVEVAELAITVEAKWGEEADRGRGLQAG